MTDIDSNTYPTVVIGGYEWMAENLRTGKYADGTVIQRRNAGSSWQLTDPDGGWDWYGSNSANEALYGRLYEANAINQYRDVYLPLCPSGWQIPSNTAWQALADALGGASTAGPALKSTEGWSSGAGTNSSGFAATAGGRRRSTGYLFWSDSGLGTNAYFWSSTNRNYWYLQSGSDALSHYNSSEWSDTGMSVRCVRVAIPPVLGSTTMGGVDATTATVHSSVADSGTSSVSVRGVVWGTSANPTLESNQGSTSDGAGTGGFSSTLSGLSAGTRYYVRAYASSFAGTTYGEETMFEVPSPVSGDNGFRLLSAPRSGQILQELLEPIWTQGVTGGDVTNGSPNVWTFNDAVEGDWTAVTDLTTETVAAGQGILVYVFADTDYSGGDGTLPVTLSVGSSGTANVDDVTLSGIGDGEWVLAGNPYAITLDWDSISKTNVGGSVYVYDHGSTWRTWNGMAGQLAGGRIAPYQGFFVIGNGGGGSLTLSRGHAAGETGTFYKGGELQEPGQEEGESAKSGSFSLSLSVDAGGDGKLQDGMLQDQVFLSFGHDGLAGADPRDALKLMPFSVKERALLLLESLGTETGQQAADSVGGGAESSGGEAPSTDATASTWSIAHLPWDGGSGGSGSTLALPLQVMHLLADPPKGHVPASSRARLSWDAAALPPHVNVTLRDRRTGEPTPLTGSGDIWLQTHVGEPVARVAGEGTPSYRARGDAGWELVVDYSGTSVSVDPGAGQAGGYGTELPSVVTLAPNYPNPFNPSTLIRFGLPAASREVTLRVYDVTGRHVATLLHAQSLPAGWHEVRFDASALASGVYVYTVRVSGAAYTRAFTLTR